MSVRRRKHKSSATWNLDFQYKDPVTGELRRHREATEARTKAEALTLERERLAELTRPPPVAQEVRKEGLFGDYARQWLDQRRQDWSASTWRAYEQMLRQHLVPAFGALRLRDIGPEQLDRYKSAKVKGSEEERALSPKSVNNHLGILSSLFETALRDGYIERNPSKQVSPCRARPVESCWLSFEQFPAFIAAAQRVAPEQAALLSTALLTGMRLGELAALRWEDIDLTTARVHVRRSHSHGATSLPKSGKGRTISITPDLLPILAAHRGKGATGLVFPYAAGEHLDTNRVKHALRRTLKEAKLPRVRFHDLRHSYASALVSQGNPLPVVQALMGHADFKTTMRYTHLSPNLFTQAAATLRLPPSSKAGTP